ncbi:MAG: protein kinase domain-containing protein [Gemmatimonadota bacterium]
MIRPGNGGDAPIPRDVVNRLYERARELEPEARAPFVETAGETPELRDEVLSLLGLTDAAEGFFQCLSEALPAPPPYARGPELSIGQHVGHYEILGRIGAGGMGTVYRARDTRLERDVALKFLPPHLTSSSEARARLLLEARAAAALEHPNVCTVYEMGETGDGRAFIAMALCRGETLRERLERGPLLPEEAVTTATQIAHGLAAAHAHGILHRDVKPGNVMLTEDGTVKLLDFGLAKLADVTLTTPEVHPGTVAYMSPEQARGDALDSRTDLWSLGIVLYEMLTGVRPFRGGSDRLILDVILQVDPPPVSTLRPGVPARLGRIVDRLLRKERDERYGSATELLADLDPTQSGSPGGRRTPGATKRRVALATAGMLAAAALFLGVRTRDVPGTLVPAADPAGAAHAIAILPFSVHGQDLEIWREGMVDLLSMGLDGAGDLRAIDSRTLLALWNEAVGTDAVPDLGLSLEVARRTGAKYALVGSGIAAGPQVRFAADVYDLESGRSLGQAVAEGPSDSTFALVDRLAMETLAVVFQGDSDELPAIDLAAVTTPSLPALKAYLDGEVHYRRSEPISAVEAWERAVRADTLFALAYYGLSEAYAWEEVGDGEKAFQRLDRAYRLADRLPAREAELVRTKWSRWHGEPGSLTAVEETARRYPDDAEALYNLADAYLHRPDAMRGPADVERAFRRAAGLQPASALYRAHLLELAFWWRPDSARVAREVEAYERLAPRAIRTQAGRIAFALAFGDSATRARARIELDGLDPQSTSLAYELLGHSRFSRQREIVQQAIDWRSEGSPRTRLVRIHSTGATDGRIRQALAFLDDHGTPDLGRDCGRLHLSVRGLPVPGENLAEGYARNRADSTALESRHMVACAAGYAAERGRWREHAELLAHAQDVVRRELAAGDSASARRWQVAVREAEAHGFWHRGRKDLALRNFERILRDDQLRGTRSLWYVGRLAFELGRLQQAERAFQALWYWDGPPAQLYLGRIYERTDRRAEALKAYESVVYGWRNADPELQPLIEEARQAIRRLTATKG